MKATKKANLFVLRNIQLFPGRGCRSVSEILAGSAELALRHRVQPQLSEKVG